MSSSIARKPNITRDEITHALYCATEGDIKQLTEQLAEISRREDCPLTDIIQDLQDHRQRTIVHTAAECGKTGVITDYICTETVEGVYDDEEARGTDVPSVLNQTDYLGRTALALSVIYKQESFFDALLAHIDDQRVDCNLPDALGWAPLHHAVHNGDIHLVAKLLLVAHANPEVKAVTEERPLHMACKRAHVLIADLLLRRGANPIPKDILGNTPAHYAAEQGNGELITLLAERGDLMMNKNDKGDTPKEVCRKQLDLVSAYGDTTLADAFRRTKELIESFMPKKSDEELEKEAREQERVNEKWRKRLEEDTTSEED
jgi:ankyrin repeat protein